MSKIEKHEKHDAPPIQRREFISRLASGYGALTFTPTLLTWLLSQGSAQAQTTGELMPFLVFDLAGGASLPGNFLVGNHGGPEDLLKTYSTLGWDPREADALEKKFGLPMSKKNSKLLAGILATASVEAQKGLRFSSFLHTSQDDTGSNSLSAIALVSKAGLVGKVVHEPLGTSPTPSGGNSLAAFQNLGTAAVSVSNLQSVLDSASFIGALQNMNPTLIQKMSASAKKLNATQLTQLNGTSGLTQAANLHEGFFKKTSEGMVVSPLDPRANPATQQIYAITPDTALDDQGAIFAGVTLGAISGSTGPGVLTIGGCDYHDGSQTTGDKKDLEIGQEIGRAVELAFRLKKKLFFQIFTDGGLSSSSGTRTWTGDSGLRSATIIGVYDPSNTVKQRRLQVGRYTDGEVADTSTIIGGDVTKVATAVFINYLNASGRLDLYQTVFGAGQPIAAQDLDSVICFDRA